MINMIFMFKKNHPLKFQIMRGVTYFPTIFRHDARKFTAEQIPLYKNMFGLYSMNQRVMKLIFDCIKAELKIEKYISIVTEKGSSYYALKEDQLGMGDAVFGRPAFHAFGSYENLFD